MIKNTGVLIIPIATIAEVVGVFVWIMLAERGEPLLGALVLLIALEIERITVYMTIVQVFGEKFPHKNAVPILVATGFLETAAWISWLAVVNMIGDTAAGHIIGLIYFSIITLIIHSVQMAWFAQLPLFHFVTDPKSIVFSILEAGAGFMVLALYRADQAVLGGLALLILIAVEHVMMATKVEDEKVHLKSVGAIIT